MFRPAVILFGVLATCAALAGCAHKAPLTPQGEVVVVATGAPRQPVAAKLRNLVRIQLPPVQTAGHAWTIVAHDYRFLQPRGPLTVAPDGSAEASFIAIRPGRRPVRFLALPPGAVAVPSQAAEIVVTIQ